MPRIDPNGFRKLHRKALQERTNSADERVSYIQALCKRHVISKKSMVVLLKGDHWFEHEQTQKAAELFQHAKYQELNEYCLLLAKRAGAYDPK